MKIALKFGVSALLGAALMFGVTSCHDDDPNYSNVTPPVVTQVHNISGSVVGMDGNGIKDAVVTMSGTAAATQTTDENGYFVFENVAVGTYSLKVTAAGKFSKETAVTVTEDGNGKNVVWNVMLASEESVTDITVGADGGEGNVTTEALEGNDKAEIPVEVAVSETSLNKEATIQVSPIYTEAEAGMPRVAKAGARADATTLVVGAKLSCSDNTVEIEKAIDLTFSVDDVTTTEVKARKYTGGQWVEVPSRVEGNKIIVAADEFTSYGLFAGISFTSTSRYENLVFARSLWDNLYGSGSMHVGTATYTYKVGMDVETKGTTVFTALLIEALARQFGANSYETQGNCPINVTLPIGTKLEVSGVQQINSVKASVGSRSVSGTQYGDVTINIVTGNRSHTGSSGGRH